VLIAAVAVWRTVGWRRALGLAGISLVVVLPWLVRNQIQVDTFRLTTSEGFNLAAVYSPQAQRAGEYIDPVFDESFDGTDFKLLQFGEAAWNSALADLAFQGLKDDPAYVATVVRRNAAGYFELSPGRNDWPEGRDGRNMTLRTWSLPLFYAVTMAGCVGLFLFRRRPTLWVAIAIVGQFVVLSLVLVAPPRLRAPFDLLMCVGVGLLVGWLVDRRRNVTAPAIGGTPWPQLPRTRRYGDYFVA